MSQADRHEPPPKKGKAIVYRQVIRDIRARALMGNRKYGTYLETFNGRSALMDAYQESLDLAVYLRQRIMEDEAHGQNDDHSRSQVRPRTNLPE